MKQRIRWKPVAALILLGAAHSAYADTPSGSRQQSFQEYRRGLLQDFNNFRSTIIERYADFLNGEWHEYESYRGLKRDPVPKPRTEPKAPSPVKVPEVTSLPALADAPSPLLQVTPEAALPTKTGKDTFLYYGIPMELPQVEIDVADRLFSHNDYAAQWKRLQKRHVAEQLLPGLKKLAADLGLNDYLTYKLIEAYADARLAYADLSSRTSLVHFLLVNMGYNVRLGTTDRGVPVLLIPVQQTIYARPYMLINGLKYYLFTPGDISINGGSVSTCKLPENIDIGRSMDMRLGELKLPMKPKKFEFQCGPISLTGEVNENLMPLLYHYPQMPVSDYAESNLQPRLRQSLVKQMREQLTGLDGDEAVERLLTFMHSVFTYATDEDFHGFEKPYFLEETLYYPKNDCEDRAIFYAWFLWNALGREAQLVSFPGHEAVAVRLEKPVQGTSYPYEGEDFYISDPTFIGARTGMVMPDYRRVTPKIDLTFK